MLEERDVPESFEKIPMKRIRAVDIIRGLAILFMVWVHFTIYFSHYSLFQSPLDYIIYGATTLMGPFSAPFFFIMSGMSVTIATTNRRKKGVAESKIRNHILKRGMAVIFLGYCISFMVIIYTFSFTRLFNQLFFWELLQSLGLSMILSYFSLKLSIRKRIILIAVVLGLMLFLSFSPMLLGQPPFNTLYVLWFGRWYYGEVFSGWGYIMQGAVGLLIYQFVKQILWLGAFPLIPWFFFSLFGTLMGSTIIEIIEKQKYKTHRRKLYYVGSAMIAAGFLILVLSNIPFGGSFYIDSSFYCITISGSTLLIFLVFYDLYDNKGRESAIVKPIEFVGHIPLTLYILHVVMLSVIFTGINLYLFTFAHIFYFPFDLIPTSCVFLGFLVISYIWQKINYKYSLDWAFAKIT